MRINNGNNNNSNTSIKNNVKNFVLYSESLYGSKGLFSPSLVINNDDKVHIPNICSSQRTEVGLGVVNVNEKGCFGHFGLLPSPNTSQSQVCGDCVSFRWSSVEAGVRGPETSTVQ